MASGRRSKRLAGDPPLKEKPTKRSRKPSLRALAKVLATKSLVCQGKKGKKLALKLALVLTPILTSKNVQATPIEVSSTLIKLIPLSLPIAVDSTLVLAPRKRATAFTLSSPFNLT